MGDAAVLLKACVISFALIACPFAAAFPVQDTEPVLPAGTTYNNETHLLCTPTGWTDIASFFVGNYISHAATVVVFPGEPVHITAINMIMAVFFPSVGLVRGILAIRRRAALYKTPVQQATRSRALCMVVRSSEWLPEPGERVRSLSFLPSQLVEEDMIQEGNGAYRKIRKHSKEINDQVEKFNQHEGLAEVMVETPSWLNMQTDDGFRREIVTKGYQVFGTHVLPSGYELAYVPENAIVNSTMNCTSTLNPSGSPSKQPNYLLSSSYSFASALIALIQIVYASVTLYQSRGGQVAKYGYASFGFTVLPFLIMSFVNLLGNLVTPSYSTLYLIESEIMHEALQRGGSFKGVVGSLEPVPLDMKGTFVFSASFQIRSERLVKIEPGSLKIYMPFDPEPTTEQAMDSTQARNGPEPGSNSNLLTPSDPLKDKEPPKSSLLLTQESPEQKNDEIKTTREKEQDEGILPLLVVPSCYKFKTAEENNPFTQPSDNKVHMKRGKVILLAVRLVIGAMPLVVVGAMSHFEKGSSTATERAWIMVWMVLGMSILGDPSTGNLVVRLVVKFSKDRRLGNPLAGDLAIIAFAAIILVTLITSAIGCFVVVSQMLREYGSCSLLG